MAMATLPNWLSQQTPQTAGPAWLSKARDDAWQCVMRDGLPTRKNERYKYADFSPLHAAEYAMTHDVHHDELECVHQHRLQCRDAILLVIVNGRFDPRLSDIAKLPEGVIVTSLHDAINTHDVEAHWYQHTHSPFASLNTALCEDGLYLYVPDHCCVQKPIHLLHLTLAQSNAFLQTKNIMTLGKASELVLFEEYYSISNSYMVNNVTTITTNDHAVLTYYKLQEESRGAMHIAQTDIVQNQDSQINLLYIGLGAQFARDDITVKLAEQGASCKVAGLYHLQYDNQYIDYHLDFKHSAPRSQSEMFFKGILENKAKAVFNGKLLVENNANKIEAYQANHNLLLVNGAEVYSKPELEIYADDVKCKHGATTGQLNQEALFYLRARGISEEDAVNMLLEGFKQEVIDRVMHVGIKHKIQEALSC